MLNSEFWMMKSIMISNLFYRNIRICNQESPIDWGIFHAENMSITDIINMWDTNHHATGYERLNGVPSYKPTSESYHLQPTTIFIVPPAQDMFLCQYLRISVVLKKNKAITTKLNICTPFSCLNLKWGGFYPTHKDKNDYNLNLTTLYIYLLAFFFFCIFTK